MLWYVVYFASDHILSSVTVCHTYYHNMCCTKCHIMLYLVSHYVTFTITICFISIVSNHVLSSITLRYICFHNIFHISSIKSCLIQYNITLHLLSLHASYLLCHVMFYLVVRVYSCTTILSGMRLILSYLNSQVAIQNIWGSCESI